MAYAVAISYGKDLGYIEYDEERRAAEVTIANENAKKMVEDFLQEVHQMKIPHQTLMDFTDEQVNPLQDERSFKLAITRLWNKTKVHVDWSRPVDYVKQHPSY